MLPDLPLPGDAGGPGRGDAPVRPVASDVSLGDHAEPPRCSRPPGAGFGEAERSSYEATGTVRTEAGEDQAFTSRACGSGCGGNKIRSKF